MRSVSFVPGLYKIFDEILVNAADNKVRDPTMDTVKVVIDPVSVCALVQFRAVTSLCALLSLAVRLIRTTK